MKAKYDYKTSCINEYKYDIFESGGEIVAYSVSWEYVEKIIEFLNSLD